MPDRDILRIWQEYVDGVDLQPMLESAFRTIYQQNGNFVGFVDHINLEHVARNGDLIFHGQSKEEDLTLRYD